MKQLREGDRLGSYRIIRPLGVGGMGCVYEAVHVELKVRRALKVFSSESEHSELLRKRFLAEGRILADLAHPRLVRVYDFALDETDGTPYFAMDLVVSPTGKPQTLEDVCRTGVDEEQVVGWLRDISAGLDYIHSHDVVHRDISLDNILIAGDGHAVIGDFGIAKITGEEYRRKIAVTATMALSSGERLSWGKGLYMAPELKIGSEATPASDAYAVGVLLFRLLSGSWYTADTRLEDSLAGLEYDWPEVIARLCSEVPSERLGADGLSGVVSRLRRNGPRVRRLKGGTLAVVGILLAGTAVVLSLLRKDDVTPAAPSGPAPSAVETRWPHSKEAVRPRVIAPPQSVIHLVEVTNYVRQTVYEIRTITNVVERLPAGNQ